MPPEQRASKLHFSQHERRSRTGILIFVGGNLTFSFGFIVFNLLRLQLLFREIKIKLLFSTGRNYACAKSYGLETVFSSKHALPFFKYTRKT